MDNLIALSEIAELRIRWNSAAGINTLQRLEREKLLLEDAAAGMGSVKQAFDVHDLRGINFANRDLSHHFLLFELDLSFSDFSGARIQGSFQSSILMNCNFQRSEILSGYFARANLAESDFSSSKIYDADFEKSNLVGVTFKGADILGASFVNADLTSTNFEGTHFGRVCFGNTKLMRFPDLYRKISESESVLNAEHIVWVEPTQSV